MYKFWNTGEKNVILCDEKFSKIVINGLILIAKYAVERLDKNKQLVIFVDWQKNIHYTKFFFYKKVIFTKTTSYRIWKFLWSKKDTEGPYK